MKTRISTPSLFFVLFFFVGSHWTFGQVEAIKLKLDYNPVTTLYDVKLVITEGSSLTYSQTIQINAVITILVPTGSSISIAKFYNPIRSDNGAPMEWGLGANVISPILQPENDYYSFIPHFSPIASFSQLNVGDTIHLFSLEVSDYNDCTEEVRLFQDGVDAHSGTGFGGADFANGYSIGSLTQLYDGNIEGIKKTPKIDKAAEGVHCVGDTIQLLSYTSGDWSVSNTNIAVFDNNGLGRLIGLQGGEVTVKFENPNGCFADSLQLQFLSQEECEFYCSGSDPEFSEFTSTTSQGNNLFHSTIAFDYNDDDYSDIIAYDPDLDEFWLHTNQRDNTFQYESTLGNVPDVQLFRIYDLKNGGYPELVYYTHNTNEHKITFEVEGSAVVREAFLDHLISEPENLFFMESANGSVFPLIVLLSDNFITIVDFNKSEPVYYFDILPQTFVFVGDDKIITTTALYRFNSGNDEISLEKELNWPINFDKDFYYDEDFQLVIGLDKTFHLDSNFNPVNIKSDEGHYGSKLYELNFTNGCHRELYCRGNPYSIVRYDSLGVIHKLYNGDLGANVIIDINNDGLVDIINLFAESFYWAQINHSASTTEVEGIAFRDVNQNGIMDQGEARLSNVMVSVEGSNTMALTNAAGEFTLEAPYGQQVIKAQINVGDWVSNEIILPQKEYCGNCNESLQFGFVPTNVYVNPTMTMTNGNTRCDFKVPFYTQIFNDGSDPFYGSMVFEFDDITWFDSSFPQSGIVNGNQVTFEEVAIEPFRPQTFQVNLIMPNAAGGFPDMEFSAKLYDLNGDLVEEYTKFERLRCSYDPNDKQTHPNREGDENFTLFSEQLDYTIRFQNTGNDTAYQVLIVDPLDDNIDQHTIRVLNSSHAVETSIRNDSLFFLFEDIYLVDSLTNPEGSQGFVTFRCDHLPGRAEYTPIYNKADIIFDKNPPIYTNQVVNTLVSKLCTNVFSEEEVSICQGESYQGLTQSGTYLDTIPLANFCDSIATTILDVHPVTTRLTIESTCDGSYIFKDVEFIQSGLYSDTTYTSAGCIDTIYNLDLTINVVEDVNQEVTLCDGESYKGYTESGTYSFDSIDVATGCELSVNLDLRVVETQLNESEFTICEGEVYLGYDKTGIYRDTIYSPTGCVDTVHILDLEVLKKESIMEELSICSGESYNGYSQTGTYVYDSTDVITGCEVEVTLELSVLNPQSQNLDTTICEGEAFLGYDESGVYYIDRLDEVTNCEVIDTLVLDVLPLTDPKCITSVHEVEDEKVMFYPNPVLDQLIVNTTFTKGSLTILDAMGRVRINQNINGGGKSNIDVHGLSVGVYILEVKGNKYRKAFKFVKM